MADQGFSTESNEPQQDALQYSLPVGGATGGGVDQPPLLSPPQNTHPTSATAADFMHLIQYWEASRVQEEARRRREEEIRRQEDDLRRQEEAARFTTLIQLLSPVNLQPTLAGSSPPLAPGPHPTTHHPPPQKAIAQNPPPLKSDASFQVFREWRRRWDDYAVMVDLASLPREKQLIQMWMCLSLETQRILEHTLQITPSTDLTVDQVLDALQSHIKSLRNEALRRRDLFGCKQSDGESFADFYVRLQRIAEEVDICHGNSKECEETQLKMIILMGICDEELIQKLICLPSHSSLQDMVNACRSFEATRSATSAIRALPNQVCAVSANQKKKKGQYTPNPSPPTSTSQGSCQFCARRHDSGKCPAADSICNNCGRHGHWARTSKCPATSVQCNFCNRMGHYEKCCKQKKRENQKSKTPRSDDTAHLRPIVRVNAVISPGESPPLDTDRTLQDLRAAARVDPSYTRLLDCVSSGFPSNRYDLHSSLLPFWKIRDNLSIDGELVLYGARVIVPAALRRRTLSCLHDSHRGVESTKRRAKQTVFWPGIDSDITSTVHACESCQMFQPSQQQEPLVCQ